MTQATYLIHRASKRGTPGPSELALLDRDLAEAGIAIPADDRLDSDLILKSFVDQAVKAALRAA